MRSTKLTLPLNPAKARGDVEAIVALRNALDDTGVDLVGAAGSCLGPLGPSFDRAARIVAAVLDPSTGAREWN